MTARAGRGEAVALALVLLERRLVTPDRLEAARVALAASAGASAVQRAGSPRIDPRSSARGQAQQLRYGPYEVVSELARGGMGVVYVVEREGQRYALKSLLPGGSADPEARVRFKREAELMGRLDHPHIVRVHAADIEADPPWLVQTLLPGGSLTARLRQGTLEPGATRALGIALARALEHAHARGVLHRDLKPDNVLFDDRGEPRLVDFGLAEDLARGGLRLTRTGDVLGTPTYMSPEQARGERADARADVYGLGALLYAALTGRPPHDGTSVFAVVESLLYTDPPRIRSLAPRVPPALEAAIDRAMHKDRDARPQDMGALIRELEACAPGREPAPPPPAAGSAAVKALAVAAALSVLAVVSLIAKGAPIPGPADPAAVAAPPSTSGGREPLRRLIRGDVAAVLSADWLRDVVRQAEAEPPPRPIPLEEAALEALRIAAGDRPPEGAKPLLVRLERAPAVKRALRDVLYRLALEVKNEFSQQAELRAAAELGPPADDGLRVAVVRRWMDHARPGLLRVPELAGGEFAPSTGDVVARAVGCMAMAQRADPTLALMDFDHDAGEISRHVVRVAEGLGANGGPAFADFARLSAQLVEAFPEDAGTNYCKLELDDVARDDPEGIRRGIENLGRLHRASRGAGPAWSGVHDFIINDLRYRMEVTQEGRVAWRALLRREAAAAHCGDKALTLLSEVCVVDAGAAPDVAAARALLDEAGAALARLALSPSVLGVKPVAWFEALDEARAGLAWYEAQPVALRPALPLPSVLTWTAEPGVYRLHHDGSRLRWIGPATFTMGAPSATGDSEPVHQVSLTRGVFLGEREVSVEQYERFLAENPAVPRLRLAGSHPSHAATGMTWEEAQRYCAWTGGSLPDEAHWELAARGVDGDRAAREPPGPRPGSGGTDRPMIGEDPTDVSPAGCLDMVGGVEEWVQDPYLPYPAPAVVDPATPAPDAQRIRRGGSWIGDAWRARALTRRDGEPPTFSAGHLGFRVSVPH